MANNTQIAAKFTYSDRSTCLIPSNFNSSSRPAREFAHDKPVPDLAGALRCDWPLMQVLGFLNGIK